ncbi:MAG: hypothetical protein DRQ47_02305 [Gammaproteobacteria bacterium]|nr:MAG: hypothetical protein DRQ47_02305 [Gammaproteobacteria bacterium]
MKPSILLNLSILCLLFGFGRTAVAAVLIHEQDDTKIDFQLSLKAAVFQNNDAWFGVDEEFLGADVNNWAEQAIEFGFSAQTSAFGGTLFGELTAIQTRTYGEDASGLGIGVTDPSAILIEQGYVGWKSGEGFFGLAADALTLKAGRFDYSIGSGLQISDGGADGGDQGGWYLGARNAFKKAFLASLNTDSLLLEGFYLENQPRKGGVIGTVYGSNLEYLFEPLGLTFGATYFDVNDPNSFDFGDFNVISLRATWETPDQDFILDVELVKQGEDADGEGYWLNGSYQWQDTIWSPTLSYRFAHLSGDDLSTTADERFRTVAYGFSDYGSWFQGEIAGDYLLENSNLDSHLIRLQLTPTQTLAFNVLYYKFELDQQQLFGAPLTDSHFGDELDLVLDWVASDSLYVTFALGWLQPGDAAKEWTGGENDWLSSMVYLTYSL